MTVLLLLLAANPAADEVIRDRVDVVEVNHYFDEFWNLAFDQVIWWELQDGEYRVVDWRILHEVRLPEKPRAAFAVGPPRFIGGHASPLFCHHRKDWYSRWYDEKCKRHREVRAATFRETWTQVDPELLNREQWPHQLRRGLKQG